MIGIVLCGGQSIRMGTDKGLIKTPAANWAQLAAGLLNELQLPVSLSVNGDQYQYYKHFFNGHQLIKDDNSITIRGPLRGLLSVHLQYLSDDLFILACDMPLMKTTILQKLLENFKKQKAGAYVYTNDGTYEPLCGIYTAVALTKTLQMLNQGQLLKHSMKYLLEQIDTFSIPLAEEQKKYFKNFNTHADLNDM